jgi:hypothetical protein
MTRLHTEHRRRAFTIVEMLVASALIMFMMWIIAAAFQAGLESFRSLKTAGDMQEKLRAASTAIRRDLTRPHFEDANTNQDLGDQRLDQAGWRPPLQGYFRIYQDEPGILDGLDPDDSLGEMLNHYRVPNASQPNSLGHVLQFTVRLRGVRRDQYFLVDTRDGNVPPNSDGPLHQLSFPIYNRRQIRNAMLPGGTTNNFEPRSTFDPKASTFTTIWGEVTYFVRLNGTNTGGIPLYNLYRRQNLLTTDDGKLPSTLPVVNPTSPINNGEYLQIGSWPYSSPQPYAINTQYTVTAPIRRFGVQNVPAATYQNPITRYEDQPPAVGNSNHPLVGADLMLTDVTNFAVKVLWETDPTSTTPIPQPTANPDYPFDTLPPSNNSAFTGNKRIFDTWSRLIDAPGGTPAADDYGSTRPSSGSEPGWNSGYATGSSFIPQSIPLKVRVRGIQIEMRIWDVKSKQSRQVTIIQDM